MKQDTKTTNVKSPKLSQSPSEGVNEVNGWLTWDQIKGSNSVQTAVTVNLGLPTSRVSSGGVTVNISYASNNTEIISNTGVVTRPAYPTASTTVNLTATISSGSVSQTKQFSLTVTGLTQTATQAVTEVNNYLV